MTVRYMIIEYSWSDRKIFPLAQGLQMLEALSYGVPCDNKGEPENAETPKVYSVSFITEHELSEHQRDRLLNITQET
jgi:hypothetical protein